MWSKLAVVFSILAAVLASSSLAMSITHSGPRGLQGPSGSQGPRGYAGATGKTGSSAQENILGICSVWNSTVGYEEDIYQASMVNGIPTCYGSGNFVPVEPSK